MQWQTGVFPGHVYFCVACFNTQKTSLHEHYFFFVSHLCKFGDKYVMYTLLRKHYTKERIIQTSDICEITWPGKPVLVLPRLVTVPLHLATGKPLKLSRIVAGYQFKY